jgi:hypothetical protein
MFGDPFPEIRIAKLKEFSTTSFENLFSLYHNKQTKEKVKKELFVLEDLKKKGGDKDEDTYKLTYSYINFYLKPGTEDSLDFLKILTTVGETNKDIFMIKAI